MYSKFKQILNKKFIKKCENTEIYLDGHYIANHSRTYLDKTAMETTEKSILESVRLLKLRSIVPIILLLPSSTRIYLNELQDLCPKRDMTPTTEIEGFQKIKDLSLKYGFVVWDLTEEFLARKMKGEYLFIDKDGHYNKQGNIVLADFLKQKLNQMIQEKQETL